MTAEEIKTSVKKNRNWAVLGILIGVLLIGGYVGFDWLMTPARPALATASAKEIVGYLTNPRGMGRLTDIEQRRFLENWQQRINSDEAMRTELTTYLRGLSDSDRKKFVSTMVGRLKDIMVADAKALKRLPANEQNEFVFNKTEEFTKQEAFIKDLAKIFESDLPDASKLKGWIYDLTTPAERELLEPYLAAIQRAAESRERMEKARNAVSEDAADQSEDA